MKINTFYSIVITTIISLSINSITSDQASSTDNSDETSQVEGTFERDNQEENLNLFACSRTSSSSIQGADGGSIIQEEDGSCTYPSSIYSLLKLDSDDTENPATPGSGNFDTGQKKYIYIQVEGNVTTGTMLINTKSGGGRAGCDVLTTVTGPACVSNNCATDPGCSLTDIGIWDPTCIDIINLAIGEVFITNNGQEVIYRGYQTDASNPNITYWYYEITSLNAPAISHLTFGLLTCTEPTASIGDYVWLDDNANGLQDVGETGLAGIMVTLLDGAGIPVTMDANGASINPITTGSDGFYEFTNLPAGTYKIQFGESSAHNRSITTGGDDTLDSDADETTGITPTYTLNPGDNITTVDAGYVCKINMNGQVFYDNNQLRDGWVNGSNLIPGGINAVLVDVNDGNKVVSVVSVPSYNDGPTAGMFTFEGEKNKTYIIYITSTSPTIGTNLNTIESSLPGIYSNVGDFVGTGAGGDNLGRDGISTSFNTDDCQETYVKFGILKAFTFTVD